MLVFEIAKCLFLSLGCITYYDGKLLLAVFEGSRYLKDNFFVGVLKKFYWGEKL